jgi:hypothetical protein
VRDLALVLPERVNREKENNNMAKVNYTHCIVAMQKRVPFRGNTLSGVKPAENVYQVYSYNTLMYEEKNGVVTFHNTEKYSVTTSKHQNYIRKAFSL